MTSADKQKAPVRIDGDMSIYQAAELKQTLLAALDGDSTVELDLSGVGEIDSAGLQLLVLAKKTAQAGGGDLCLAAQSDAVAAVLELLNLASYFGDQIVIPPRKNGSFNSSARNANGS